MLETVLETAQVELGGLEVVGRGVEVLLERRGIGG